MFRLLLITAAIVLGCVRASALELVTPSAIKDSHEAIEISDGSNLDSVLNSLESAAK
jgi:hypothetical protein